MSKNVLALDQGTTSSRAVVFNRKGDSVAVAQQEFPQILPAPGHVEHDPEAIWKTQLTVAKQAISKASLSADQIAAIGITNQRETTVVWDRTTGEPVANAIVWQSRVTAPFCDQLRAEGYEETIRQKTGLTLDAYFSATKIAHLLDQYDSARERADRGELLFGTVDSFLIWRFTGGRVHATDYSNASRTLLFNIETLDWDDELLEIFNIPRAMLPQVLPSSCQYGETEPNLLGARVPITGDAGDQHAATFGQACFQPGNAKNTYGTGCFLLMNTGNEIVRSQNRLITTIGWGYDNTVTYCLEGSVFIAGAVVQWLRDGLGVIEKSSDVEALAATVPDSDGVYFVPAFVGLGAPYWDPYARGAVFGITRGTTAGHLARAALESMAFQTRDLIEAMQKDAGIEVKQLKVDGGAATNDLLMQFQSDLLDATIRRPVISETTALGAAYLAGLEVGVWSGMDDVTGNWMLDCEFSPQLERSIADQRYEKWQRAVQRSLEWESG